MKVNYSACAICDSNWGDLWKEVDGERLFFCCEVCVVQFRNLIRRIKAETKWPSIDAIEIAGNRRGRTCRAVRGSESYSCTFTFNPQGVLRTFQATAASAQP